MAWAVDQEFGCLISDADCLSEVLFQKAESCMCTRKITECRLSLFSWKLTRRVVPGESGRYTLQPSGARRMQERLLKPRGFRAESLLLFLAFILLFPSPLISSPLLPSLSFFPQIFIEHLLCPRPCIYDKKLRNSESLPSGGLFTLSQKKQK